MNVFEAVKQSVTTRQAAEHYGVRVGRNGMCVCPFHDDKNPSMKVDRRFHCFGCQADGDVIDFVSRLENVSPKEAALMLAQDFSVPYEDREPPGRSRRPKPRQESPEQQFKRMERHCFRVLSDYHNLLHRWKRDYALPFFARFSNLPKLLDDVEQEGFFPHRKGFDVPKRNREFIECFREYLQKQ